MATASEIIGEATEYRNKAVLDLAGSDDSAALPNQLASIMHSLLAIAVVQHERLEVARDSSRQAAELQAAVRLALRATPPEGM